MEFMSKALPLYPNEDFPVPEKEPVTRYVYPPPGDGVAVPAAPAPGAPLQPAPPAAAMPPVTPDASAQNNRISGF
jgi:hypothetical protein